MVNIFSKFNISEESSDRKIGDQTNKSNNSIKFKTAVVSYLSQNANTFPTIQEHTLKDPKIYCCRKNKELFKHSQVIQVGISNHCSFVVTYLKGQVVKR